MRMRAEPVDIGGHIAGAQERFVIGIDETREGGFARGEFHQLEVIMAFSLSRPGLAAALKHPESHDVFQEARGAIDAAFVGEIHLQGFGIDDRSVEFRAEKRPCSGAQKRGAFASGDGGDGRTGVVGGRSNDGCIRKCGLPGDWRTTIYRGKCPARRFPARNELAGRVARLNPLPKFGCED